MFQARLLFAADQGSSTPALARRGKSLPDAPLKQSLLLAALLHVWLVLLLGNAPGGTAKPGEGVWGRLNITLRGPENGEPSGSPQLPPPLEDSAGPVGQAKQPRFGGAPRPLPAADQPKPAQPGAAQLGAWQAAPGDGLAEVLAQPKISAQHNVATASPTVPVAAPAPAPTPAVMAAQALPPAPAPFLEPAVPTVAPMPNQALPAPNPLAVPKFEALPPLPPSPEHAPLLAPAAVPVPAAAPVQLKAFDAAPSVAVQRARPVAVPKPGGAQPAAPQALDLAPALPALQSQPEPPVEVLPPPVPQVSKSLPEPVPLPSLAAQPLQSPSALTPLAPSALERAPALPPMPAALVPKPAPTPAPALNPLVEQAAAPSPSADAPTPAAAEPPSGLQDRPPVRLGQPGQPSPRGRFGTPDAGSRLGHDVATPPSASASAPQAPLQLNLSLPPRPRGGELSGRGSRGVLELLPTPPERKSKLSQEMENAAKQDCRKAYAEGGLLAAVPLAVDALRDKGCRW